MNQVNQHIYLNPDYLFRNDKDRVVMYSKKDVQDYSMSDWMSFIHPAQALLMLLCSGKCLLGKTCGNFV